MRVAKPMDNGKIRGMRTPTVTNYGLSDDITPHAKIQREVVKHFVDTFCSVFSDFVITHVHEIAIFFYPHMPIGKVWMYRLLCVCMCVCLYGYGFLRR